jgi:hypothetical protein
MNFKTLVSTCVAVQITFALHAKTWSVTSTADSGVGSLRDTINVQSGPGDTIFINLTNTIFLTSGEIPIAWTLDIVGPGPSRLTIDASKNGRAFHIFGNQTHVSISGMTVQNGLVIGAAGADGGLGMVGGSGGDVLGGAILADGVLFLSNCWFNANAVIGGQGGIGGPNVPGTGYQATNGGGGGGAGGGAVSLGTMGVSLSAIRCTFSSNTATGGAGGTGGYNSNVVVILPGGDGGNGGPVSDGAGGFDFVTNCTFSGNQVIGGQGGQGGVSVAPTSGGAGGKGGTGEAGAATLRLHGGMVSCTIVSNSAIAGLGGAGGAGSPNGPGGADGIGRVGGLLADDGQCDRRLGNTIVANNFATTSYTNCDLLVVDLGFNFIGDNVDPGPCIGSYTQVGTVQSPLDPQLGPLAQNGGGLPTHAPLLNSPVIGYGSSLGTTTDERNAARPFGPPIFNSSDGTDIGAVELGSPPLGGGIGGGGSGGSGGGPNFIVSWPSSYGDVSLQSAPGLSDPSAWSMVTNTPVEIGDQFVVSNSIVGPSMFYRLILH